MQTLTFVFYKAITEDVFFDRYISPSPPQPPPRRLSESSSVPGSPQHFNIRRNDLIRNTPAPSKFQFIPQPQRRAIYQINDL